MTFDLPHMAVTALLILVVLFALRRASFMSGASRGKQVAVTFAALFVVLFVLNLLWPYGETLGS